VILDAEEDRLLVISDLHLGNPASTAVTRLVGFLDHAADIGASVCVNGDGFEMLQTSFTRLVSSSLPVLAKLRRVRACGGSVYYVVGNHDIVLEHFLDNVLVIDLSPFLNLRSGGRRIRIEHGHLYDPFFARYPRAYGVCTRAAGLALLVDKDIYRVWTWLTEQADRRRRRRAGDVLELSYCHRAAEMLLSRGFDAVVFGHTHNAEVAQLPSGLYANAGNWLRSSTYIDIDHGEVSLRAWTAGDGAG
jgi:UDP-2,3-diacylglucosamine pyrophosphatase LpxH